MNASILRDFFLGRASARDLQSDLVGTTERTGHDTFRHHMTDLNEDFVVEAHHLIRVCDAVLENELDPELLAEIGFGVIASDHFMWDSDTPEGERVGNTLHDWASPEVNFGLNSVTVDKFKHRLMAGEDRFTHDDHHAGRARKHVEWRPGAETKRSNAQPSSLPGTLRPTNLDS